MDYWGGGGGGGGGGGAKGILPSPPPPSQITGGGGLFLCLCRLTALNHDIRVQGSRGLWKIRKMTEKKHAWKSHGN